MAETFLDSKLGFSDPASSGLRYLRDDATWAEPDAARSYLDSAMAWTKPKLQKGLADMTWSEVLDVADKAAADPGPYKYLIGQEKNLQIMFNDVDYVVTAVVVGVGENTGDVYDQSAQDWINYDSLPLGLTFWVRDGLPAVKMHTKTTATRDYTQTYLFDIMNNTEFSYQSELGGLFASNPNRFPCPDWGYSNSKTSARHTVAYAYDPPIYFNLMSLAHHYTKAELQNDATSFVHTEEGTQFSYFVGKDIGAHVHHNANGGTNKAWLCTWYASGTYCAIGPAGRDNKYDQTETAVPSMYFCLGI